MAPHPPPSSGPMVSPPTSTATTSGASTDTIASWTGCKRSNLNQRRTPYLTHLEQPRPPTLPPPNALFSSSSPPPGAPLRGPTAMGPPSRPYPGSQMLSALATPYTTTPSCKRSGLCQSHWSRAPLRQTEYESTLFFVTNCAPTIHAMNDTAIGPLY